MKHPWSSHISEFVIIVAILFLLAIGYFIYKQYTKAPDESEPEDNLTKFLERTARHWQNYETSLVNFISQIEALPAFAQDNAARNQLRQKRDAIGKAVQSLVQRATSPELILATTGTTSSGKSTLANFLIGEEVLPSAVQEMSAGLVTIRHHDTRRALKIPFTKGASWETGEWDNLPVAEVRERLAATMEKYREAEKKDPENLAPVTFEIDWPIRLAANRARLGLPVDMRMTILDLPGLKSLNDPRNSPVIQEHIKEALCLVTYNSEETDDKKQKELLKQVVSQVNLFRNDQGTLGRMIFLLNRIDVFFKDENTRESFEKFKVAVKDQLRNELQEAIEPSAISSLPALWAIEANLHGRDTNQQNALLEKIETHFQIIFPKNYWDSFPRNFEDFTDEQRQRIIEDTLLYAKAHEFETRLNQHISENIQEIILDNSVKTVSFAAAELLNGLDQWVDARIQHIKEEIDTKKSNIQKYYDQSLNDKKVIIRILDDRLSPENFEMKNLEKTFRYIERNLHLHKDSLLPIIEFYKNAFSKSAGNTLNYCIRILSNESDDSAPIAESSDFQALHDALLALRDSPYGETWEEGGKFENGPEAEEAQNAWENFVQQLSITTTDMFAHTSVNADLLCKASFKTLAEKIFEKLTASGNEVFAYGVPQPSELETILHSEIPFEDYQPLPINFFPHISEWDDTVKRNFKEISQERTANTLWLFKEDVERTVEREVDISGIAIPVFEEFVDTFYDEPSTDSVIESIYSHLYEMIEIFYNEMQNIIEELFESYNRSIENYTQHLDQQHNIEIEELQYIKTNIQTLMPDAIHKNINDN